METEQKLEDEGRIVDVVAVEEIKEVQLHNEIAAPEEVIEAVKVQDKEEQVEVEEKEVVPGEVVVGHEPAQVVEEIELKAPVAKVEVKPVVVEHKTIMSELKGKLVTGEIPQAMPTELKPVAKTFLPAPVVKATEGIFYASLMYITENNGELFMKWSTLPLDGALAYFSTEKKIPAFKMNKHWEICKSIGFNKKRFMEGLATFFKEVDSYGGKFTLLDCGERGFGDVWASVGGKKWGKEAGVPRRLNFNEELDINSYEALAVLPHTSSTFQGILKIDLGKFINSAQREGAVWKRG